MSCAQIIPRISGLRFKDFCSSKTTCRNEHVPLAKAHPNSAQGQKDFDCRKLRRMWNWPADLPFAKPSTFNVEECNMFFDWVRESFDIDISDDS